MAKKQSTVKDPGYSIGVVSRLTGIHPETLRMWERRYEIVSPRRSEGKSRRYSDEDIHRLALVKTLVDAGHQISLVAPMTIEQLRARLEATSPKALESSGGGRRPCRLIVLGSTLPTRLAAAEGGAQDFEIVRSFPDDEALKRAGTSIEADVLVAEYATLQRETLSLIRQLLAVSGARRAVVVYGFASRQALRDLEASGVVCLRSPAGAADIANACRSGRLAGQLAPASPDVKQGEEVPPPRFTSEQLGRIAVRATVIACECPHHLVDLINSLSAFETFSRECQNRNPQDAEIHAFLFATAGRCRAMLEAALQRVAEAEGIELT